MSANRRGPVALAKSSLWARPLNRDRVLSCAASRWVRQMVNADGRRPIRGVPEVVAGPPPTASGAPPWPERRTAHPAPGPRAGEIDARQCHASRSGQLGAGASGAAESAGRTTKGAAMWLGLGIVGLIIWIAIAFWPARVARRKGHSFVGYFILSLFFFPVALIMAYVVKDRRGRYVEV